MGCGCKQKNSTSSTTTREVSNVNVTFVENSGQSNNTSNVNLTNEQEKQVDLIIQKINEMNSGQNNNQ